MNGTVMCGASIWWIFPIIMMVLCFLMMRGRRGSMMCCFGGRRSGSSRISDSNSAEEILEKRYAFGDISKEEYEEKKRVLGHNPVEGIRLNTEGESE